MAIGPDTLHEIKLEAQRLRAMLAGLLDPVVIMDPMGIILAVSDSILPALGYKPAELVGQNINVLMPEPHHSQHDEYLERYRRTGKTWILDTTRQFQVVRKDGSLRTCELSVARIEVEEEGEHFFCGAFRDVTARVEAEARQAESERRFRAIFDQEYQFVGLLDVTGRVLEANRTSLDLIEAERDDIVGLYFWETPWWAHSKVERDRVKAAVAAAASGEFVRFETTNSTRTGELASVDFSLKPIMGESGEVMLLLPEGREITALKESQRRETSMLRAMAAVGESASVLAHEIKNPITAVNIALRAVADRLGQDQSEILEDLVKRMQKLERTMRRTLSFAKPVKLACQPCRPRELVREAFSTLQPLADQQGIELELKEGEGLPKISVDFGAFEEVLVNLLRNAIEAVEKDGLVRVRLQSHGGMAVGFVVEDDGPGVPPSLLHNLFKPFYSSKEEGTGLGLAVARRVIEEHGGTLEHVAGQLSGAAFRILVPSCLSSPPEEGSTATESSSTDC